MNNLSRAKKTVMELAYCNKFDYFCTFTFSPDKMEQKGSTRYDLSDCRKKLSQLFHNYKVRYSSDFKYLIIPEFHKDGAIHFHGLVSGVCDLECPSTIPKRNIFTGILEQVPNTKGYLDWPYYSQKFGHFSCGAVRNQTACSRYIVKYITKDLVQLPRGQQAYLCSKGLKRAELIFDCDDVPMEGRPSWHNEFVSIQWHDRDYVEDRLGYIDAVCSDLTYKEPPEKEPVYEQVRLY